MSALAFKPAPLPVEPPARTLASFADRAEASMNELASVKMAISLADYCRIMAPIVALIGAAKVAGERGQ